MLSLVGLRAAPVQAQGPDMLKRQILKAVNPATRRLMRHDRYAEALPLLTRRLEGDSLNVDLLVLRAACHLNIGGDLHATLALADLNKSVRLQPAVWLLRAGRAAAYAELRQYAAAEAELTATLALKPVKSVEFNAAAPDIYTERGCMRLFLNHIPAAQADYEKAVALTPGDGEYALYMAFGHMINGSFSEAMRICSQVVHEHPDYALGYAYRALLWQRLPDSAGARQDANEAIRLAPTDTTTRMVSAFIYQQAGDMVAAQRGYNELKAEWKEKSRVYFERGDLYWQSGNLPDAEANWRRAVELGNKQAATRLTARYETHRK